MQPIDRVLIVGGGPVGLTAALALGQRGVPVTLFEHYATPFEDPRAATLHPPSLEMLSALGAGEEVIRRGLVAPRFQFRDRASFEVVATFDLAHIADATAFPYCVQCEQHKVAAVLLDLIRSGKWDIELRLGTTVSAVAQDGDGVALTADGPQGEIALRAPWIVGADGGRSTVRKALGIGFEGFTWRERFLVVTTPFDFRTTFGFEYRNYLSDPAEWCALFKVPGSTPGGHWRVVFPTPPEETDEEVLSDDSILRRLTGAFGGSARDFPVMHRNLYIVNQRVAARFRQGRAFLVGDAAHANNPLGGLGMNSGIHDAVNLAGKLAEVWHGRVTGAAAEDLLDRYHRQRHTVAHEFVQAQTIRNKQTLEERDPEVRAKALAHLRATASDPVRARPFLMNTSLLASITRADAIP